MYNTGSRNRDAGFNLLELMAVVAIIGIIMMIAVASYAVATTRAVSVACANNRRELSNAAQRFAYDHGEPAATINDLAAYVKNFEQAAHCAANVSVGLVFHSDTGDVTCPTHAQ